MLAGGVDFEVCRSRNRVTRLKSEWGTLPAN